MDIKPKVALCDGFLKSMMQINKKDQHKVLQFVAKFRQNPRATGINYEPIHDAADPNMRSVRIDQDVRGIVLKPAVGDIYCLLWVDRHDDAYQWARRHRVQIHPDVGAIQIFAVDEGSAPASGVSSDVPLSALQPERGEDVPRGAGLFAALRDRQIRALGVPEQHLAAVRAVMTEDDLERLQSMLPDDAFEALFLYAAGESYDSICTARPSDTPIDTNDFAAALERDESRRHFVVLTDDSDIEALLAAPLERWRVFLHPSQRRLVNRDWSGPVKVTGGAGTGKTVVAMHRARYLAQKYKDLPGRPVVFTTFTKTLAEDIEQNLKKLCTPQELERIQVVNLDRWAFNLLKAMGYRYRPLYDEKERQQYWERALAVLPEEVRAQHLDGIASPLNFVRAEYERVILPQGCETLDDYLRARRIGRGGKLGRSQKKAIWPVFAEYRALLTAAGLREPEEAYRDARLLLEKEKSSQGVRAMIVDEGQDISAAAYEFIRAVVPEADNDLFIVGDAHQRIYRHKVVLGRVGINVRGRSRSLRLNYRTTDEIRRWACAQLAGCEIDDLDGNADTLRGYRSLTHGEEPEVISSASVDDDVRHIRAVLMSSQQQGIEARKLCVTVRDNNRLRELAGVLTTEGIPHLVLNNTTTDDPNVDGIRLATMHRVKGLEFDVVIVAAYEGADHYAEQFSRDSDAGVAEDAETAERCLLLVAATRAKRQLIVLSRRGGQ